MKSSWIKLSLFFCIFVFSKIILASTNVASTNYLSGGYIRQVTIMLVVVIAVIFAISFFLKRTNLVSKNANEDIKVLNTLSIGTKEKLLVLEVNHNKILLGVGNSGISYLCTISKTNQDNISTHADFSHQLMDCIEHRSK